MSVVILVSSDPRLLVFMGRVYYIVYHLSAGPAGPRNVATYALNRLTACEIQGSED
ncbi:MAG: hypothetical protein ACYSSN_06285 [Planctomycetota bacterium]